ncbi:MAG TPA: peptide-methionine (S)-S-oxide reductase MsrA [Nevskiaceae bacterium]|nr:peptide-methionine (S)-S-oxide reductase MsrA [Nevskiaceae bacterium]
MIRWLLALLLVSPSLGAAEPARAIFAAGCFWCVEADFEKLPGVIEAVSGYTGGHTENPTYEQSNTGLTGHTEAVEVRYDPARVSYEQLLEHFWRNVDPFDAAGQFCDKGSQYRAGIFPLDEAQMKAAQASKAQLAERFRPRQIVTEITPAGRFWLAEAYHQNYYQENPLRYQYYRRGCGRDAALKRIWATAKN